MWVSAWVRTPEKEKSQLGTLFWAALKANLLGSPPFASISMAAPPERFWHCGRDLRFKHLATWKITNKNNCLIVRYGRRADTYSKTQTYRKVSFITLILSQLYHKPIWYISRTTFKTNQIKIDPGKLQMHPHIFFQAYIFQSS